MKNEKTMNNKHPKIAVIGLGYVGLPLAAAFANHTEVIGFDLNEEKINLYKAGIDPTQELGDAALQQTKITFTADETKLDDASFFVVAVPTPVNLDKTPDLTPVISASTIVGRHLHKGDIVVFESTVYPGVTEDVCVKILEQTSSLTYITDFKVGYSPERINPADKVHRLNTIKKIVSGCDEDSLEKISRMYSMIIDAGVHPVSNIKTAEAIKVVENSQRDINIAFMNELAMVFDRMGIDTQEVIEGMNTKWNALGFRPGLVGGHCIGVDPYYFIYQAELLGYHSQIILNGRKINDQMAEFVAQSTIKSMILAGKCVKGSHVVILGITFKENCPDTRNSKVHDIIKILEEYGCKITIVDPVADVHSAQKEYGRTILHDPHTITDADCIVVAVAHESFTRLTLHDFDKMYKKNEENVLIDVKSIYSKQTMQKAGYCYWRL